MGACLRRSLAYPLYRNWALSVQVLRDVATESGLELEVSEGEVRVLVSHRRFSFRSFLLGDESSVPARLRPGLKNFLHGVIDGLRNIEPAMSLQSLHEADL